MNTPLCDRFLSVGQVADFLSLSTRTVRRLLPKIGFVQVGDSIRIPSSCLETYLQSRYISPKEISSRCRASISGNIAALADGIIDRHHRGAR